MEHLYDTHFHLDLQKDCSASIREIEENQLYAIAVTNLPVLFRKETVEIKSKYIRIALGFHPELIHQYPKQISLMWELLPEARYVGEVGLDFVDKTYQREQVLFLMMFALRANDVRSPWGPRRIANSGSWGMGRT